MTQEELDKLEKTWRDAKKRYDKRMTNLLSKEHTAKCSRCKHGKAAHKGACKMKYCKCEGFKA